MHNKIKSNAEANGFRQIKHKGEIMVSKLKKVALTVILLFAAAATATSTASAQQVQKLSIINNSHHRIDQIFVSPSNYRYWGENQLGDGLLPPDYYVDMAFAPDIYDIKLVEDDGDGCVVNYVDVRNGWTLTVNDYQLFTCDLDARN